MPMHGKTSEGLDKKAKRPPEAWGQPEADDYEKSGHVCILFV